MHYTINEIVRENVIILLQYEDLEYAAHLIPFSSETSLFFQVICRRRFAAEVGRRRFL